MSTLRWQRSFWLVLALLGTTLWCDAAVHLKARSFTPNRARPEVLSPDDLYVLVSDGPVTASMRSDLENLGVSIEAYVPEDALIVRVAPGLVDAVLARSTVEALVVLEPSDRLSRRVFDEDGVGLVAQLAAGVEPSSLPSLPGAQVSGSGRQRVYVETPPGGLASAARALASQPGVLWVEPVSRLDFLNDTSIWVGQSWDVAGETTPVFSHGLYGEGQVVAVSDTGLDADHACFYDPAQGLPGPVPNLAQRKVIAYHDRLGTGNWDDNNHGTHTAGSIACDIDGDGLWDPNLDGQAPDGMAPAARLTISDAKHTDLPGNPIDLNELFAETWADGARIHSNSWVSCSCNDYTVHSQDVDQFVWEHPGMAIFFAAGNAGPGLGTVRAPSNAKNCITVGATQRAAAADALAGFSSRGPAADGRLKPTVTAPGQAIRSARGDRDITSFNDGVSEASGTSMATPTAAGLATLAREYLVKGFYPSGRARAADALGSPSAALLKALLVNSARSMADERAAPSQQQGWGRILLDDVLYFSGDSRRLWLHDAPRGLGGPGERRDFRIVVGAAAGDLKVTLVWSDRPAATLVGPSLVNDLDLVVTGPDGNFLGNVFAGEWSEAGGSADRVNVVEGVRLDAPGPGVWTLSVVAANVPFGPQPFALVATGDVQPASRLAYLSHAVTDGDGDSDGVAEPGELVRLSVTLAEQAGAAVTGIVATLRPLVAWATLVGADDRAFPDAPSGGTTVVSSPWVLALAPDAPCGEPLRLALDIDTDQGSREDSFVVATGGDIRTAAVLLEDDFDRLAAGDPPDGLVWTTGFVGTPHPAVALRVEAVTAVEPAGSPLASAPNALYVGRDGGNRNSTTYLATRSLDLTRYDRASLSFSYWVRELEGGIAEADWLRVEASNNGGLSFPHLLYTNPDYATGMDSSWYPEQLWHDVSIELGPAGLLGADVVLRFVVVVNADEPDDAVYLDDVRLEAETVSCEPGCIAPSFLARSDGPVCLGTPSGLGAELLSEGFGSFSGHWSFGDTTFADVASLDEPVSHAYAAAGAWMATLEAVSDADPSCRRSMGTAVDVDSLPLILPLATSPVCAADPEVTLGASVGERSVGPMSYRWRFGDGSPDRVVATPDEPLIHLYPPLAARWDAELIVTSDRVPGCVASFPVAVEVVDSMAPAGSVGNALRVVRASPGLTLEWSTGALSPRQYNLHRTDRPERLVESAAILGSEPVVASPSDNERASDDPPVAPLWLYEVLGRDCCSGASVFP